MFSVPLLPRVSPFSLSYTVFLSVIQRYIAIFQMQPTSHTYESAASAKGAPGSSGKSYANSNNVIWTSDQSKYLTSALGSSQVEYRRIVDVQYSTKTGQTTTSFVGCAKTVTKTTRQRRRTQEPGKSDVTRQKAKGGGKTGAQEPGAKVAMNAARKGFASLSLPPEGKCTHVYFTGDNGGVPSDGEVEARLLTVTVFNDVKDGSGALRDHLILTVLSLQYFLQRTLRKTHSMYAYIDRPMGSLPFPPPAVPRTAHTHRTHTHTPQVGFRPLTLHGCVRRPGRSCTRAVKERGYYPRSSGRS